MGESEEMNGRITIDNYVFKIVSTCVIGREKCSRVDLTIENSQYISRRHLKIISQDGYLLMTVYGSNGIFVDDTFYGYGSDEITLPHFSILRFPSTNIIMKLESQKYLLHYPLKKRINPNLSEPKIGKVTIEEVREYSNYSKITGKHFNTDTEQSDNECHVSPRHDRGSNTCIRHTESPIDYGNEQTKPPYSYAQLIVQAICSTHNHQMTLSDIYYFISSTFPYYKMHQRGWQNSIRHNLSLNRYFIRVPRSQNRHAKSAYWQIDKDQQSLLFKQAFWKRRAKNSLMITDKSSSSNQTVAAPTALSVTTTTAGNAQHNNNFLDRHEASMYNDSVDMETDVNTDNELQSTTNSPISYCCKESTNTNTATTTITTTTTTGTPSMSINTASNGSTLAGYLPHTTHLDSTETF